VFPRAEIIEDGLNITAGEERAVDLVFADGGDVMS